MLRLLIVAVSVLVLNLPFGYFRAGARRLSLTWFVAVHAPVPMVAGLRYLTGLGWELASFPVIIAAYATGQLVGGRLRLWRGRRRAG